MFLLSYCSKKGTIMILLFTNVYVPPALAWTLTQITWTCECKGAILLVTLIYTCHPSTEITAPGWNTIFSKPTQKMGEARNLESWTHYTVKEMVQYHTGRDKLWIFVFLEALYVYIDGWIKQKKNMLKTMQSPSFCAFGDLVDALLWKLIELSMLPHLKSLYQVSCCF